MPNFTIIKAKPWHCGQMVRRLRAAHAQSHALLGINSHRELRACFEQSSFARAWLIDGQLAALGGVTGTALSMEGMLWLALAEPAKRYPVAIVKEAKRQLAAIMLLKREVWTTIVPSDDAAKRLAIFLGFHVGHDGGGAPAISRAGRRMLAEFVENDEDCRIPMAGGFAVAMGYHAEGWI